MQTNVFIFFIHVYSTSLDARTGWMPHSSCKFPRCDIDSKPISWKSFTKKKHQNQNRFFFWLAFEICIYHACSKICQISSVWARTNGTTTKSTGPNIMHGFPNWSVFQDWHWNFGIQMWWIWITIHGVSTTGTSNLYYKNRNHQIFGCPIFRHSHKTVKIYLNSSGADVCSRAWCCGLVNDVNGENEITTGGSIFFRETTYEILWNYIFAEWETKKNWYHLYSFVAFRMSTQSMNFPKIHINYITQPKRNEYFYLDKHTLRCWLINFWFHVDFVRLQWCRGLSSSEVGARTQKPGNQCIIMCV